MSETDDEKSLVAWGFAPGGYNAKCKDCQRRFYGEKRAWRCFTCATAKSLLPPALLKIDRFDHQFKYFDRDMRSFLIYACERAGSVEIWAGDHGVSVQWVREVLDDGQNSRLEILQALNLEERRLYASQHARFAHLTKYGIQNGQIYRACDGRSGSYEVIDCETYANVDDVVVRSLETNETRRIDSFKLAMVRYYLDDGVG